MGVIRRAALLVGLVLTSVSPAALLDESPRASLPLCEQEDSTGCVWDCIVQGNHDCAGNGRWHVAEED